MNELRYRTAQLLDVSYPERTIEVVVMPYETPTVVHDRGRSAVTEIVSRGAFDGIEKRSNRVTVNRDHDVRRTIGRAIAFHPSRQEGLVSEIRISRTELGDETLELASDGILDASAGYRLLKGDDGRVKPNAEVWETRNRCRLNHLFLDHIAMTPTPAFTDARVLAVRAAGEPEEEPAGTPNLDRLRLLLQQDEYAGLDARYSRP